MSYQQQTYQPQQPAYRPQQQRRPIPPGMPPQQPPQARPPPDKIVEIRIKMPEKIYIALRDFAAFLHSQPLQDQMGRDVLDANGQKMPALKAGNIETYFMTCAINTFQGYQAVLDMARRQQAAQQAHLNSQPQVQNIPGGVSDVDGRF